MRHYIMDLRRSIQAGEDSRVYNYTQREMAKSTFRGLAGDTIDMMYNTGYYHDSDEDINRDIADMKNTAAIRRVIGHFRAIEYAMQHIDDVITYEHIRHIHNLIYNGAPIHINRAMIAPFEHEPYEDSTGALREVTALHTAIILSGGDTLTAGIISYWHCLNNYTAPFYVHAENRATYERHLKDVINAGNNDLREIHQNKLAEFFRIEQDRYRRETEGML